MNSGELMVVLIVAIVMIAGIFKQRARSHHRLDEDAIASGENQRLRELHRQSGAAE